MVQITPKDEELIALLKVDSREPVASLARKLGLSRTTVQDRLKRLEETGIISAYTVRLSSEMDQSGLRAFVTLACATLADTAIVPMQDVLALGSEARINVPGTVSPRNWAWRLDPAMLTDAAADALRATFVAAGR